MSRGEGEGSANGLENTVMRMKEECGGCSIYPISNIHYIPESDLRWTKNHLPDWECLQPSHEHETVTDTPRTSIGRDDGEHDCQCFVILSALQSIAKAVDA